MIQYRPGLQEWLSSVPDPETSQRVTEPGLGSSTQSTMVKLPCAKQRLVLPLPPGLQSITLSNTPFLQTMTTSRRSLPFASEPHMIGFEPSHASPGLGRPESESSESQATTIESTKTVVVTNASERVFIGAIVVDDGRAAPSPDLGRGVPGLSCSNPKLAMNTSTFGGFSPLSSATLSDVAKRLGATPMQIALAWLLRRSPNILPIPGTSNVEHLRENLAAADLELSDDVMKELDALSGAPRS